MIRYHALLSILLFVILFVKSFAQEEHATKKTISFCFEEWRPFSYINEQNIISGIDVERLKTLLSDKYTLQFSELPFRRCMKSVQKNLIDFILHIDESDNLSLIKSPLNSWQLTLAVAKENHYSLTQILNDSTFTLLIAEDYEYPPEIKNMFNNFSGKITKRSFYTSNPQATRKLYRLLEKKAVDAILVDKTWAEEQIKTLQIPVKLIDEVIHSEPQFIGYANQKLKLIADDIFNFLSKHDQHESAK